MEHIDWLMKDSNSEVTGEELEKPYAWYDNRIYTRREFEQLREEAGKRLKTAVLCAHKIEDYDKQLFFDNLDTILKNRSRIYSDRALGLTHTIDFSFEWSLALVDCKAFSFQIAVMLKVWENGDWRKVCPKCGELSYQYKVHYPTGFCFCPHCKDYFTINADMKDKAKVQNVLDSFYPESMMSNMQEKLSASFTFKGKNSLTFTNSTFKKPQESVCSGFREMSAKWRKEYDEVAKENVAAQARFEMAQKRGEQVENFKICIEDANRFLNSEFTTPMEKFLGLLKNDREVSVFEMNESELERIYRIMKSMESV